MKKQIIRVGTVIATLVILFIGYRFFFGVQAVEIDESEQEAKISSYAHPESFITPKELKEMLDNDEDVVVIGTLNPTLGDLAIDGSFTMWRDDYSANEEDYDYEGMLPEQSKMEEILSSYGASPESTIVVYASNAHHDAARLWWQIKVLGHEKVRYLDGGLNAWVGEGYPTSNEVPQVEASHYIAPNPSDLLLATFEDVENALESDIQLIDTRAEDEETGETIKSGAFGAGKILGSTWINWTSAVNDDSLLKTRSELEEIYGEFEGQEVITYCQSGVRSAHTLFVLTQALGYEDVRNYDGSWIEWSYKHYEEKEQEAVIENGNE